MPTPIAMPRQGQSVETCVIQQWHKNKGDEVKEGDILFTYETDKASFEYESPAAGVLLETFFDEGADVDVLANVAVVGSPGEDAGPFRPDGGSKEPPASGAAGEKAPTDAADSTAAGAAAAAPESRYETEAKSDTAGTVRISPRARERARARGVDPRDIRGSGPGGRIIERDVEDYAHAHPGMTPTAAAAREATGMVAPAGGTGPGGRVTAADLRAPAQPKTGAPAAAGEVEECVEVKISNMRKLIGERMMESLRGSAQLTLHATADASALLAFRKTVKEKGEALGLTNITITDLIAFAFVKTLAAYPQLNCRWEDDKLMQYAGVHLSLAVDTPRGLVVPVIRYADRLSLNDLAVVLKERAAEAKEGSINPDLLSGGTVTLSNLGNTGIEYFTPILNPPQVAILGVNTIRPRPAAGGGEGEYVIKPHVGLSLTIDHRALDGAPSARFMKAVCTAVENINLTLSR